MAAGEVNFRRDYGAVLDESIHLPRSTVYGRPTLDGGVFSRRWCCGGVCVFRVQSPSLFLPIGVFAVSVFVPPAMLVQLYSKGFAVLFLMVTGPKRMALRRHRGVSISWVRFFPVFQFSMFGVVNGFFCSSSFLCRCQFRRSFFARCDDFRRCQVVSCGELFVFREARHEVDTIRHVTCLRQVFLHVRCRFRFPKFRRPDDRFGFVDRHGDVSSSYLRL